MNCFSRVLKNRIAIKPIFILITLISLVCLALYRNFLLGEKLFLYMDAAADTFQQFWPYLTFMSDALRTGDIIKFWSFQIGIGTSTFCIGHFLFDVFNWLLIPMNSASLAYGIIYIYLLKIMLAGIFFYLWVKKFEVKDEAAWIGALLYAFNSYMVLWGQFMFYATAVVYAPLILYAAERGLRESKWILLSVAIGLAAMASFYLFFMLTIALLIYIVIRVFQETKHEWKRAAKLFSTFALWYALGLGLVAVVLLPSISSILSSPRVNTNYWTTKWPEMQQASYWISVITRSFSDGGIFMSGKILNGSLNWDGSLFESPHLYTGLLICMVMPQLFYLPNRPLKRSLVWLAGIMLAFLIFPILSSLFEGFMRVAFRWTFVYCLFVLFIFTMVFSGILNDEIRINRRLWIISGLGSLLVYILAWYWGKNHYSFRPEYLAFFKIEIARKTIFMLIYCGWGLLWGVPKLKKYLVLSLLLLVAMEMMLFHNASINRRYPIPTQGGYVEARSEYIQGMSKIIRKLQKQSPDFHRMETDASFTWGPNDPFMLNDFYSTTSYLSIQQPAYVELQKLFNTDTPRSWQLSKNTPADRLGLKSLLNIKYFLSTSAQGAPTGFVFEQCFKDETVPTLSTDDIAGGKFKRYRKDNPIYVFKNPCALPLGYVQSRYLEKNDFAQMTTTEKDQAVMQAVVLETAPAKDWQLKRVAPAEVKSGEREIKSMAASLQQQAMKMEGFKENDISGAITVFSPGIACFAIPYDTGWNCRVNGAVRKIQIIYGGLMGVYLAPGQYHVRLHYVPAGMKIGLAFSIISWLALVIVNMIKCNVFNKNTRVKGQA